MPASGSVSARADAPARMADIVILGATGQVGRALRSADWRSGLDVATLDRAALDLAAPAPEIGSAIVRHRPRIVINAAAYTAVDRAEDEPETAHAVNDRGVAALAAACAQVEAALIHLSTDYVFDGTRRSAYTEDDAPAPLNVYGRSKLDGELGLRALLPRHVILRTSWVFSPDGTNFVKTMLRLGGERPELQIVDDQIGCPTAAADIAAAIQVIALRLLDDPAGAPAGIFHFSGRPAVSWYGFAAAIFGAVAARGGQVPRLRSIASADYPAKARRPAHSVLECTRIARAFGIEQPSWAAGLDRVLSALPPPREKISEIAGGDPAA